MPDGEYTVWLVASDAEWGPPLFEVWANGQKKLDVQIPRARFVFLERFQARASAGRLQIEFKGPHGWLLNGLVVGKPGPELEAMICWELCREGVDDCRYVCTSTRGSPSRRRSWLGRPSSSWTIFHSRRSKSRHCP